MEGRSRGRREREVESGRKGRREGEARIRSKQKDSYTYERIKHQYNWFIHSVEKHLLVSCKSHTQDEATKQTRRQNKGKKRTVTSGLEQV